MPTDQRWHSDTDREYCSSRAGYAAPADTSSGKYGSGILTMYVCTYVRMYVHTYVMYICMSVQYVMYIRMYVCRCVLGVAFVHVHTSIRTHVSIVHTYVHTV